MNYFSFGFASTERALSLDLRLPLLVGVVTLASFIDLHWIVIRANSKCEMRVVPDPDGAAEEEEEPPLHGVVKCDVVWYVYH